MNVHLSAFVFSFLCVMSCGENLVDGDSLLTAQSPTTIATRPGPGQGVPGAGTTAQSGGTSSVQGTGDCTDLATLDSSRGACNETLPWSSDVSVTVSGDSRTIRSNGIPGHRVGLFGSGNGSLNPNAIREQSEMYTVDARPQKAGSVTYLYDPSTGPQYAFGVTLNGVEIDPEAAEPWPHARPINFNNVNWAWNLDAMAINLGLDCNNAHVQPTGKYHYHGAPTLFLEGLNASASQMTLVGYAADGFPIYYKYGYADGANAGLKILQSSYRVKSGERPGDGSSAPCGEYSGIYTADYEYVPGLGDLDACNGREGVTPEYPDGTYYYVITDSYPFVGRCLVGTPSSDFRLR